MNNRVFEDYSEALQPFPHGVCVMPDDISTVQKRMRRYRIAEPEHLGSAEDMCQTCAACYLAVVREGYRQPAWRIMEIWAHVRGLPLLQLEKRKRELELIFAASRSHEQHELCAEQIIEYFGGCVIEDGVSHSGRSAAAS